MRATKRVCSILLHLSRTWGQEGLVLRPDPRRCTPLLKGMAWSVESVDSHLQVVFPRHSQTPAFSKHPKVSRRPSPVR